MTDQEDLTSSSQRRPAVLPDDLRRTLLIATRRSCSAVSIAGGTYAILISGQDTNGHCSLIDMKALDNHVRVRGLLVGCHSPVDITLVVDANAAFVPAPTNRRLG